MLDSRSMATSNNVEATVKMRYKGSAQWGEACRFVSCAFSEVQIHNPEYLSFSGWDCAAFPTPMYMSHDYNLRWAVCGRGVSLGGSSFRVPYSGGEHRAHESGKISSEHPQGLHARIDLCILKFVGTISCERKVCGEAMPLPATNTGECLAEQRNFPGRLLPNSLV